MKTKDLKILLSAALCFMAVHSALAQNEPYWPNNYGGVMLQGFSWNSFADTRWTNLAQLASDMDGTFDLLWIPNAGNCGNGWQMGYAPLYWFPGNNNYNSSFGTEAQLRSLVSTMRSHNIGIIGDVVINHRANVSNWVDFPQETYNGNTYQLQSTDIVADDDHGKTATWVSSRGYSLSSTNDTGDDWDGMRDLDHTSANVQNNVHAYLSMLRNDLGYAGFRYDMAVGYSPSYITQYNRAAAPSFSVGECWKSSAEIKSWIDGTAYNGSPTSAAFDFQFFYTVVNAIDNNDWTKLGQQASGYPLVSDSFNSGNYRRWAVTFVENHDVQDRGNVSNYTPRAITRDTLAANAYMLAMPGTPCVFLPHYLDYKHEISNMIAARKAAGITNTSSLTIQTSNQRYYVVRTGRLWAVVGSGASSYAGNPQIKLIQEGYHYKYFMTANSNIAWLDKASGTYNEPFNVKAIRVASANTYDMVYTTNGDNPTASSATINDGATITVDRTMTVKLALKDKSTGAITQITTRKYTVNNNKKITVYFKAPENGWNSVNFYTWDGYSFGDWPGMLITKTKTILGRTYYYHTFELPTGTSGFNLIVNNGGSGGSNQTATISITQDVYLELGSQNSDGNYTVNNITNDVHKITVHVEKPADWGQMAFHSWGCINTDWPGQVITDTKTVDGITYHYKTYDMTGLNSLNFVFNNNDNGKQTVNIENVTSDVYYRIDSHTNSQGYNYVYTPDENVGIYVKTPATNVSDWGDVAFYVWDNNNKYLLGDWPGTKVTTTTDIDGVTYYYRRFALPQGTTYSLIVNNNNSGKQTVDVTGLTGDVYLEILNEKDGNKYKVKDLNEPEPEVATATVYLKDPGWNEVHFYVWDSNNTKLNGEFPGAQVSSTTINGDKYYYYTVELPTDGYTFNVIFSDNSGKKTNNITGISRDTYYRCDTYNGSRYPYAEIHGPFDEFRRVKSVSDLQAGREYIIVYEEGGKAMGRPVYTATIANYGTQRYSYNADASNFILDKANGRARVNTDDVTILRLSGAYNSSTGRFEGQLLDLNYDLPLSCHRTGNISLSDGTNNSHLPAMTISFDATTFDVTVNPTKSGYTTDAIQYNANADRFSFYAAGAQALPKLYYRELTLVPLAWLYDAGNAEAGKSYIIDDELTVMLSRDGMPSDHTGYEGHSVLLLKDADGKAASAYASTPGANQQELQIHGEASGYVMGSGYQSQYEQSNWIMQHFYKPQGECGLISAMNLEQGRVIKPRTVKGKLEQADGTVQLHLCMDDATYGAPFALRDDNIANDRLSVYTPANFLASNLLGTSTYFWMKPKPLEMAKIVWAVYSNGAFYMPAKGETLGGHNHNDLDIKGGVPAAFAPGLTMGNNIGATTAIGDVLTANNAYEFTAIVYPATGSTPVGRLKAINPDATALSDTYTLEVASINPQSVVTAINHIDSDTSIKAVRSVRIFNAFGVEQRAPVTGVNIIVTEYTDGSTATVKLLK